MSRVAKIELFHVAIPLPSPFYPAWIPGMPQTENRFTLIRVTTDDGVVGHSAGPAIARERAGLGDLLGPYLLGEDADGPQAAGLVLHPHSRHQGLEGDRPRASPAAGWRERPLTR